MVKINRYASIIFCLISLSSFGQKITSSGIGYLEHLPPDYKTSTKTYPLIIFLHGAGEVGNGTTELYKVKGVGIPKLIQAGADMCSNGECFIVISPQLPAGKGGWWPDVQKGIYDHVLANYRVDKSRIYLTGLSLGGNGVYMGLAETADIFAAGVVVAGFGNSKACNIAARNIPVWAFHGEKDATIKYGDGLTEFNRISWCDVKTTGELKWTMFKDAPHAIWDQVYALSSPNIYEWLLSKRKGVETVVLPPIAAPPIVVEPPPAIVTPPVEVPTPTKKGIERIKTLDFQNIIYISKDNVYSGTKPAGSGEKYTTLTLTDVVSGNNVTWTDNAPRKSFLDKSNGLSHNRNTPTFYNVEGEAPYIYFPNVIGSQFVGKTFQSVNQPYTSVTLFMPLTAVQWEGGIGLSPQARDRGDYFDVANFTGAAALPTGIKPVLNRWNLLIVEDNGDKSRVFLNGKQVGGYITLPKSFVNCLYLGTNSHVQEHKLSLAAFKKGLLTDTQRKELISASNEIVPMLSTATAPIIFNPVVQYSNGAFSLKSWEYHSPNGVPIDPESVKIEWIWIPGGNLDAQRYAGSGAELRIDEKGEAAAIVTCTDLTGNKYEGPPFRSEPAKK